MAAARNRRMGHTASLLTPEARSIVKKSTRSQIAALVRPTTGSKRSSESDLMIRKLLTPVQVQELLEVSESWLKRSDIPFIKLGRLRRYDVHVVEQYLTARLAA